MVEDGNNFILDVDENNIEELLEGIPGELANDELLELEKQRVDKEEAREKICQEKKRRKNP